LTYCHKKTPVQTKSISYRKIKAVDIDCFKHELASSVLCYNALREHSVPEDRDRLVNVYNSNLTSMIDKHAPLTTKSVKARSQVPWYDHDKAAAKRKRRKAERIWRKSKAEDDLQLFKRLKNLVTYISNKARREFYAQFINENGNDQNRLFRATNDLLHPKDAVCFPDYSDDTSLYE
jgi:transcription initiation factor IIF auxiliary subunit